MEDLFLFPLTIKGGRVFDASGADITEAYHNYQHHKSAEKIAAAFEQLAGAKRAGTTTRHMLYIDHAYHTLAVIETFIGDNLSERLQLSYAGIVKVNERGDWFLDKINRRLIPIESLADLYRLIGTYNITLELAEKIWDHRESIFYILQPSRYSESERVYHNHV